MGTFCIKVIFTLSISFVVDTAFASLKARPPNPGGSKLFPETKEFIKKMVKATSVQDIKKLQEEDDTFMVHDLSETLPKAGEHIKGGGKRSRVSCETSAKEPIKVSSQIRNSDVHTERKSVLASAVTEFASSGPNESIFKSSNDMNSDIDDQQQQRAVPNTNSAATDVRNGTTETEEEIFELVDFGKSTDVTEPSGAGMSGYESLRHDHNSLASSVERQMQEPSRERRPTNDAKDSKKNRKKRAPEPPPPTKEELEATYKYEVLAPPDNSPVKLDFPASPHAQGEEHLSQHVPLTLYCDTCMAIAYQVHLAFAKFHGQVRRRPPTESEVYHLVSAACQRPRYYEYGMLEVHGHRHMSGPGCNQLEAEGGVKHSRGPWPRRLADRCEEVTEDVGELTMHQGWLLEGRDPERFKMFMCFGDPPRNFCEKYGHMDAAAEAAARLRSRAPEVTETPIEAASRLAREAEEAELRRLVELGGSEGPTAGLGGSKGSTTGLDGSEGPTSGLGGSEWSPTAELGGSEGSTSGLGDSVRPTVDPDRVGF